MEYCGAGSVADIMKLRNKVVSICSKNSKIMNTPLSVLKQMLVFRFEIHKLFVGAQ